MKYPTNYSAAIHPDAIWTTKKIIRFINNKFKKIKVLDIGCGIGYFLFELSEYSNFIEGYGIDIDKEKIQFCKKLNKKKNLNFFVNSADNIKFKKDYFDIVMLNHVLEHVKNPTAVIKEAHRVLKKGGYLIIGTPSIEKNHIPKIPLLLNIDLEPEDHIVKGFTSIHLKKLLEKNKFKIIKLWYIDKLFGRIVADFIGLTARYKKESKKPFHIKEYSHFKYETFKFFAILLSLICRLDDFLPFLNGSSLTIYALKSD